MARQTLSQEIADRKRGLRDLSNLLRKLDSAIEQTQRLVKRLQSRKTKLPNLNDLSSIIEVVSKGINIGKRFIPGIEPSFNSLIKGLETLRSIFEAF